MKRRESIAALLTLGTASQATRAQRSGKVFRIGWLTGTGQGQGQSPILEGVIAGLRKLGYEQGRDFQIEPRWAGGQLERLPEFAAELVRLKVDVIVAAANQAAFPAKRATSTIPIVVIASHGAVESGLIASYARPGGNITGIDSLAPELDVKRLELLREALPQAASVAMLCNANDPGTAQHQHWAQVAAESLKLRLEVVPVRRETDVDAALVAISALRADAILLFTDAILFGARAPIAEFALKSRLPLFTEFRQFAEVGGLMSYGANLVRMAQDGARHIDRILKGAKPGDLPVERPTEFEMFINLKTAKALGITIPQSLLLRADELIE